MLLLSASAQAVPVERRAPAQSDLWFKPVLTVDSAPLCSSLAPIVDRWFVTSKGPEDMALGEAALRPFMPANEGDSPPDPAVSAIEGDPRQFTVTRPQGQTVFVRFEENPGCGGACDTEYVVVSTAPLKKGGTRTNPMDSASRASTPASGAWTIYRSADGDHYAVGVVDQQLEAYVIAQPRDWRLSCRIALAPADIRRTPDSAVQKAIQAVDAMNVAARALARDDGEGMCGSMHTEFRMRRDLDFALLQTLYRPWATGIEMLLPSENSYGDYPRIADSLAKWSLQGLYEHEAYSHYRAQLHSTTRVLSSFYQQRFKWSDKRAAAMASESLSKALGHGFAFYMYDGPKDATLRQAILDHKPMADIRAADHDKDAAPDGDLLGLAVKYPNALRYLLDRGANPNAINNFGKTPLMYAAQYNQILSAKLLLRAGADINARTVAPPDDCSVSLHTINVTALHYAVRYSSAPLIRLMLANGAALVKAQSNGDPNAQPPGDPLDWLYHYSHPGNGGNPHISRTDVPNLAKALNSNR